MTEMAIALSAMDLDTRHPVATIRRGRDRAFNRFVETRPARSALEFRVGSKERVPAGGALEGARSLLAIEGARACAFRAVFAEHVKLLWRERLLPLVVRFRRHGR